MEALLRHSVFPRFATLPWLALAAPWSATDAVRGGTDEREAPRSVAQLRASGRLAGRAREGDPATR